MSRASYSIDAVQAPRTDFLRSERQVTVLGACALGGAIGFATAVAIGRADMWLMFFVAATVLAIALYPASANMADASWLKSPGCRLAAITHLISLLAWPMAIQFAGNLYWLVPAIALSSLLLLASCWTGSARVVYRMGLQSVLVAGLAAHQGTTLLIGA